MSTILLVLLRLVRSLLILIWTLVLIRALVLVGALLVLLSLILALLFLLLASLGPREACTGLKGGADSLAALAECGGRETEKQDCGGDCHRTHSFRVCSPVHVSFSRQQAEMS